MDIKSYKKRGGCCSVTHHSLCVESLVIVFTVVSALAITGDMLITFRYITVTETAVNDTYNTTSRAAVSLRENDDVMEILHIALPYTTLAIAGVFVLEVLLKVCCIRARFLKQPWQVVDCLIASATLGVELAYYLEVLPYATLRAVCYIVLLRLWRLPSVCRIRAREIQSELEDEIEILRCAGQKTEDRCSWLEGSLTHQLDTIKRLTPQRESLQRPFLHDTENIVTEDGRCILRGCTPMSPQMSPSSQHVNGRQPRYTSRRWKKEKLGLNPYVEMSQYKTHNNTSHSRERSETTMSTSFTDLETTEIPKVDNEESMAQGATDVSIRENMSDDYNDEVFIKQKRLRYSEGSYSFISSSNSPGPVTLVRHRNRRSSTSEFIDYNSLSSPDKETPVSEKVRKVSSCPSLDIHTPENEIELKQSSNIEYEKIGREDVDKQVKKTNSASSGTSSGISADESGDKKENRHRKDLKRFTSCPEFVYTQRMGITSDESMLIEEGHTIENPSMYDNIGFLSDEDTYSIIMAEFDGSKTYRNEEGIPITSL